MIIQLLQYIFYHNKKNILIGEFVFNFFEKEEKILTAQVHSIENNSHQFMLLPVANLCRAIEKKIQQNFHVYVAQRHEWNGLKMNVAEPYHHQHKNEKNLLLIFYYYLFIQ